MKVAVLGLRGFPKVMGGVETHCENIYPRLVELGCEITVLARAPYLDHEQWAGVHFVRLWAPRRKSLEAILHSLLGVCVAAVRRPDILHIHAIGPAIVTPLARLAGLKVVVTHHGEDYNRQKWGRFARLVLRMGEAMGMLFATQRIVISKPIQQLVLEKYGKTATLIPNGVNLPDLKAHPPELTGFGLEAQRYVLVVGRLVPEKRHPDLVAAFEKAGLPGWKLVIVGASDHPDAYSAQIADLASRNRDVVCTGFQSGEKLQSLFANAGIFVLPSSHEGNPIAVLEALSYGLPVVLSDIPAHRQLELVSPRYFPLGDVDALAGALVHAAAHLPSAAERLEIQRQVAEEYNWDRVARLTLGVYESIR